VNDDSQLIFNIAWFLKNKNEHVVKTLNGPVSNGNMSYASFKLYFGDSVGSCFGFGRVYIHP